MRSCRELAQEDECHVSRAPSHHTSHHVTQNATSLNHKMDYGKMINLRFWSNEQVRYPCNSRVPRCWLIQFKSVTMSIYLMSARSLWLCKYSQTGFWSKIMSKFVCSRPLTWNEWCLITEWAGITEFFLHFLSGWNSVLFRSCKMLILRPRPSPLHSIK